MPHAQQQSDTYQALAQTALQQYALGAATLTFVQHNAGIVFRVVTPAQNPQFLLKLYKRVGTGADPTADQLEAGLHWLAAFAQASDVVVQVPVRTIHGHYVGQVSLDSSAPPINCTLQHWVDGNAPNGDLTLLHTHQLGMLLAQLHTFSSVYPMLEHPPAMRHDRHELAYDANLLCTSLYPALLSAQDVAIITAAQARIVDYMTHLGDERDVWGPVHGDLHYDNLVLFGDAIRPIDFTGLRLAHYLYDVGVTLYHTFHQGVAFRKAFFRGYQQVRTLPSAYQQYVEAFICFAAIGNLAWNSTIPEQIESGLFQHNLQQLVRAYCLPVARGKAFLFR